MIGRLWPYLIGAVALGLNAHVIAGLLPLMTSSLPADAGSVGLGVSVFTVGCAVSGLILVGWVGRRPRLGLVVATAVFVLASIGNAVATTLALY